MAVTIGYGISTIKSEFIIRQSHLAPLSGFNQHEREPTLVALADGGFAVAYVIKNIPSPTSMSVALERYTIDGSFRAGPGIFGETLVDEFVAGQATEDPAVAQLADGRIVTTWTDGHDPGIHYSLVDPASGLVTLLDDRLTGTDAMNAFADVAALSAASGGGFVVAMQDSVATGNQDADLRFYSSAGALLATRALGGNSTSDERRPAVAALSNGNVVVTYEKEKSDGSGTFNMALEIYGPDGTLILGPTTFDTTGENRRPDVLALSGGGFVVAYADSGWGEDGLTLAFFNADGAFRGFRRADIGAGQDGDVALAELANGFVTVNWTSVAVADGINIYSTLFDPATMTRLHSPVAIENQSGTQARPSVAGLTDGTFVSAWTDTNAAIADGNTDPNGDHVSLQITAYRRNWTGDAANNLMTGDALSDRMTGSGGNDTLNGGGGLDHLSGGTGNDQLFGGAHADWLAGQGGLDRVDGGAGADRLYCDLAASPGTADTFVFASAAGIDRVFDFVTGIFELEIDASVFGGVAGSFVFRANANPVAPSATRAILYDTDDGKLYFDADGNGAGARVHVLTLVGAPILAAGDVLLV